MADNSAAKSYLEWVESKLNHVDNMWEINAIINDTSLKLYRNLSSENLRVDEDIKESLRKIANQLNPITGSLISNVRNAIRNINTWIASLDPTKAWNATAIANLNNKRNDFVNIVDNVNTDTGNAKAEVIARYIEYRNLYAFANSFKTDTKIWDITINTKDASTIMATPLTDLNNVFSGNSAHTPETTIGVNTYHANYSICDANWEKLRQNGSKYIIDIWWQEYEIENIIIRPDWNLDFTHMRISPNLKDSPQEVVLSINSTYKKSDVNIKGTNVSCNKTFKLKLNDWTISLNTPSLRIAEFRQYNNSLPIWHKVSDIVKTKLSTNRYAIERKALENILKKNWWKKYDTLTEKQKEEFYQRIRKQDIWWWVMYFDNIYDVENMNDRVGRYHEYRNWFTDDKRDWNKWDNIKTSSKYIALIHNTVEEKTQDFIISKLEHFMWEYTQETHLKSELTVFFDEIDKNRLDNGINRDIDSDVSMESHKMDKWPRSLIHNRDSNYMRFFSWSSISLKWEKVDIYTNTSPDAIDNPEPLKYDMDINITWRNSISVEIKIEWTNEVIKHKSGEPSALIRKIMRDQRIKYGKARAHMWFNIYKAMVQMAKDKYISLQYRDESDKTNYIDVDNWNIVIRQVENLNTLDIEDSEIIFDQEKFINMNEFDKSNYNWALRQWLDKLWEHFNLAMNELHKQYREWVDRRFLNIINSPSRMKLPTSAWLSPIKKLLNLRNTTNFDFNTTITSMWKNISVDFKKNKFTVNMEWLKKPVSSRDLWKILNHREKKERVFDGMERDLVAWIYGELINKLRLNGNIACTNFGVKDENTWNMYVLDKDWEFGRISKEDLDNSDFETPMTWLTENRRENKKFGMLNESKLSWITINKMSDSEQKELMRNPLLMQRFVKAMNRRMWLRNTVRAAFFK